MVARSTKSGSQSYCNVHVELDNRALKAKNNGLTQAVAKLQQENAELLRQISNLQGESFEIKSRYNNLKNVISIIDSTTKTCLPKLTEVVDTFTGIIQLCSVASNISNANKDTRTQAVKPQIVNGHVLHNPTITLSRLDNSDSYLHQQQPSSSPNTSNISIRPSTSRSSERHQSLNGSDNDSNDESDDENGNEEQNISHRRQTNQVSGLQEEDSENSDEGMEIPAAEEENENVESESRLTTILEDEEGQEILTPPRPRSNHRRILKGNLQEVRIYLNQLPDTYITQSRSAGNISISVSSPERCSAFKHKLPSHASESDESDMDNEPSFLDEKVLPLNRTIKMAQRERGLNKSVAFNSSRSKVNASFKSPLSPRPSVTVENYSDAVESEMLECSENISIIPTPSTSTLSGNMFDESKTLTSKRFDLSMSDVSNKTSTPIFPRKSNETSFNQSDSFDSFSRSLKSNVTKRRNTSNAKGRIAQVLLNRLSLEKKLSDSTIGQVKNITNTPVMTKLSQIKTRLRSSGDIPVDKERNIVNNTDIKEEATKNNMAKTGERSRKRKKDSPTKKAGSLKKDKQLKPKTIYPLVPRSSPGRPKRAARPRSMKEPNLIKKLRRSR